MSNQVGSERMRELGGLLKKELPGLAFALLVYPLNDTGMANYISNGERSDMIKALEGTLERLKGKKDFPTPNSN